jgi:hypothetical protein
MSPETAITLVIADPDGRATDASIFCDRDIGDLLRRYLEGDRTMTTAEWTTADMLHTALANGTLENHALN